MFGVSENRTQLGPIDDEYIQSIVNAIENCNKVCSHCSRFGERGNFQMAQRSYLSKPCLVLAGCKHGNAKVFYSAISTNIYKTSERTCNFKEVL